MPAQILDGKALATAIRGSIKQTVEKLLTSGNRPPCLAVIIVGDDPASHIYVKNKQLACTSTGIISLNYPLPDSTSERDLIELIHEINANPEVDGILVQLPLPSHIHSQRIIETIDPKKDVDGFHPYNMGRLMQFNPALRPCTPYGVIELLRANHINLIGRECVVVGASNIVGKPMAAELLMAKGTVTVCQSATRQLQGHISRADLLVTAIGKTGVIDPNWIKADAVVVDVGMNRVNGHLCGDLDFQATFERASWITPVPGGVGPMTVAMLLKNTLQSYSNR